MKKIYSLRFVIGLIFFLTNATSNLKAQMVYIPDTNFRNALISEGYGSCIANDSIDSNCLGLGDTVLNITNRAIKNLEGIQAFSSLKELNCDTNLLTGFPFLPSTLTNLACNFNRLLSLPALPISLAIFSCSNNQLTNLPALPASLIELRCGINQLTNLPALPFSLSTLHCDGNQLTSLPALPISLSILHCDGNQLTNLPVLPGSLVELYCVGNQLTSLAILPASLINFSCSNNQLTNLPALPISLSILHCDGNQLTNLPVLPGSLVELYCDGNQLTSLAILPASLINLSCSNNQLTNLPVLPNSVRFLDCNGNQLIGLPALPDSISVLWCESNQLTSIPDLPDTMFMLNCANNPGLTCLPRLKFIFWLTFTGTGITCLPNYGWVWISDPPLINLPICDIFNPHGCSFTWKINGRSYFDLDTNCIFNSGDSSLRAHIFLYKDGNLLQQVFTQSNGLYYFEAVDTGNYVVKYDSTGNPFDLVCPVIGFYNDPLTISDSLFYDNDFTFKCKQGFDVGAQSINARFRPASYSSVQISAGDLSDFYRVHCASGVSGSVVISFTGAVTYVGPDSNALAPITVLGNTLTYNIADFGTVDFFTAFNFILVTDTAAAIGSDICINITVSPATGDNDPSNNTLTHCFVCRGSFDPNEKEVDPISNSDIDNNRWLTYTVHFQNTGTASAEHIYITDTLDQNLDLSTFQLLAYSHQPLVQILDGGIARFNFPNINLPDSNTNEPASHGYVQYKIKLKNTTNPGTQIRNTAYIYFDFNSPVVTNTTVSHVTSTLGIANANGELSVSVFPNPSKNEFTVYCPQFSSERKINLRLFDAVGKEVLFKVMNASECKLSSSNLSPGIYFLRIESTGGVTMKKLVKE